jgi:hypothetical protein
MENIRKEILSSVCLNFAPAYGRRKYVENIIVNFLLMVT